jgi:DNA-binding MarR family transcriptional regulator
MGTAPSVEGIDPGKADLANLLSYRLSLLSNLLSRSQIMRFEAVSDISLPEWRVLVLVNSHGPLPVKSLAEQAGLDFGQASRLVSRMCENDLVVKEKTDDARSVNLSLTVAGKALHRKLWKLAMQSNSDFLKNLDAKERTVLLKALNSLAATAKDSIERSQKKAAVAARRA